MRIYHNDGETLLTSSVQCLVGLSEFSVPGCGMLVIMSFGALVYLSAGGMFRPSQVGYLVRAL
jgi:hypothetical protein